MKEDWRITQNLQRVFRWFTSGFLWKHQIRNRTQDVQWESCSVGFVAHLLLLRIISCQPGLWSSSSAPTCSQPRLVLLVPGPDSDHSVYSLVLQLLPHSPPQQISVHKRWGQQGARQLGEALPLWQEANNKHPESTGGGPEMRWRDADTWWYLMAVGGGHTQVNKKCIVVY